jgi:hypothetical protein
MRPGADRVDQTHRFDIDMDVDRHETCHATAFRRDDKQCLRINEIRAVMDHVEQHSHQRIMEKRQEQAKPESLATNKMMARMMAALGYMLAMSLGKNVHCDIPPPNNQGRFKGDADQDCGE